ncbi:tautomerase family protein [Comamonas flocculans]|uniref:Tautomerase n=1 Tax=Comamonas flocculans TaxID=2597701 RepID=A0A5B8RXI6_9BURK|nr:tautomerase [Comamonas flocculans]QEA12955.1 tautomerase [Comamonas flocculans]
MPYIQLDVNAHYPAPMKQRLAGALMASYAEIMATDPRRITVAIRELGEGGIWRTTQAGADPEPAAMLVLDIRRGRPPEQRLRVARALCAHCVEMLDIAPERLNVEFTQHAGDEMLHPALGGFSPEWQPGGQ